MVAQSDLITMPSCFTFFHLPHAWWWHLKVVSLTQCYEYFQIYGESREIKYNEPPILAFAQNARLSVNDILPIYPYLSPTPTGLSFLLACLLDCLLSFFFAFQGHTRASGGARLGVGLELQLQAYTTAIAMPDLSRPCHLHHSSWRYWIPNPLSEARDQTRILMDTGWVRFYCATMGTPLLEYFKANLRHFISPQVSQIVAPADKGFSKM